MSIQPIELVKDPPLDPVQDFYLLRREGIGYIASAGSGKWTDYNVHDPGITVLEALCYAISDIGYRIGWDIADLLTPEPSSPGAADPYADQAFFSARTILPVNPTTSDDFRRLLIDLETVRDAWLTCKSCACEASYFAWCDDNKQLRLSFREPVGTPEPPTKVWARGLYEVLLELETDPELGDLNDRMIVVNTTTFDAAGLPHPGIMEVRFPDISLLAGRQWQAFLDIADPATIGVKLSGLGATRTYNVLADAGADPTSFIKAHWRDLFYLTFEVSHASLATPLLIENATLRVIADNAVRDAATAAAWDDLLAGARPNGVIELYRLKSVAARSAIANARTALQSHRNLCEDYCLITPVGVEQIAACADVEVESDADIELVQAKIWFELERYFSPPIRFRTLQERRDAGGAVENIFDGPALSNGFIDDSDLAAAALKTTLRGSDIINRLMDIDGVKAVNQLRLTKYDTEGNAVRGAADPNWVGGLPDFDPNRLSAAWLLFISSRHQPRLYLNQSRFMFYKNGLPFQPRMDEARDTLNQLRGDAERPKNPTAEGDLPLPKGQYRNPSDYSAVQHSLPMTYGIGPAGLPSHATAERRRQADNLKAYLTVFDQLLANTTAQLAHSADLFSLNPDIDKTYFAQVLNDDIISRFTEITQTGMSPAAVQGLVETVPEFNERRNRFLDHLLARFGEQFGEYTLLLSNAAGRQVAEGRLIDDKIAFLERYPVISRDRGKAFDYSVAPNAPENHAGLEERISLLLGTPDLVFYWTSQQVPGGRYKVAYELKDWSGRLWLSGELTVVAAGAPQAEQAAHRALVGRMVVPDAYAVVSEPAGFRLQLLDAASAEIGAHAGIATEAAANRLLDELVGWSANERLMVVEHLLLRPKFIGDALYPVCCDDGCSVCGCEDPYSFRLTVVMPGWTDLYTGNLDLRRFADRTIRQETPSHLLGKICWVGNDGFVEDPCDEIVTRLGDLLEAEGATAQGAPPLPDESCRCATELYHAFSQAFIAWYADKKFAFLDAGALKTLIAAQFEIAPVAADFTCTTILDAALWTKVRALMAGHFADIAINGWQFERFEWAWNNWLDANAEIDWTSERLQDRIEAILAANVTTAVAANTLCNCARTLLTDYGMRFYDWMQANVAAGASFEALSPFTPLAVALCPGINFRPGTVEAIQALLDDRYDAYRKVSYWLWAVVTLLGGLRNVYPGATLHDCDDGSDGNPVRLDSTVLGNYSRRAAAT